MIIMFHCDVLSNQNVIGNALMWVKNWDSCPRNGSLVQTPYPLSEDILLEPEHPLPALSNFRVTLILDNLLRLKNETAVCVHLSLSSQDLKCDQNIGRYYFNFPAPCSLPILFSAAWCNNKCYLDPYLVRGRNGREWWFTYQTGPEQFPGAVFESFYPRLSPGSQSIESGLICLWRRIMRRNMTFSRPTWGNILSNEECYHSLQ